jgi:hypothetical protein
VEGDFIPPSNHVNAPPGVEFGLGQGSDYQRIEPEGTERDGSAGRPAHGASTVCSRYTELKELLDNLQLEYQHRSAVEIPDSRPTYRDGRHSHPSDLRSLLAPALHSSVQDSPLYMARYFSHSRTPVETTTPLRELHPASRSTGPNQQHSYNVRRHSESHPTIHINPVFPWNGPD